MISTADINFDPSSKQNEDRLKKLREDEQASIEEARRRQEGKNANEKKQDGFKAKAQKNGNEGKNGYERENGYEKKDGQNGNEEKKVI